MNREAERERLIKVLSKYSSENRCERYGNPFGDDYCKGCKYESEESCEDAYRADHLLENGVIVPPCKVGDIAYFIIKDEVSGERYIASQRINDVSTKGFFISTSTLEENCNDFEPYSEIGKTIYLIEEEAEQALKGDEGI